MSAAQSLITKTLHTPQSVVRYFKESYTELKKVSWPSRETTIRYTIIVAVSSVLVGVITGGIDFLLTLALEKIII